MMNMTSKKSLSERVTARLNQKTSISAKHRAAFLALSEEIKQALADGLKSKHIWETLYLEKKINFSYPTFHGYVTKLVLKNTRNADTMPASLDKDNPANKQIIKSFNFNANPNIEDLI